MLEWTEYAKLLAALLAVMNPTGAIPIFLGLTEHQTREERRRCGLAATASAALILLVFLAVGEPLLAVFGLGIPSFRVASGILILLVALSMMQVRAQEATPLLAEVRGESGRGSVAVVPLAIPVLAGPGAISTVIVYAHRGSSPAHYLAVAGAIVTVAVIVLAALRLAPAIASVLGPTGMNVVTRIMGLILAAIGVEFIAGGLAVLLPGLLR
jgi:multiple antibiotic resistance protein